MDKKKALKGLIICMVVMMLLPALVTYLFDPFYQYHQPFFNLKAVLNDKENQVVGTIRSFDYDSVLLGSSVAENFDSKFLDNQLNCETLKVIRASGSVADLLCYMNMAHENQEIKNVFWCMDIFAFTSPTQVTLYDKSMPGYLFTDTVLDDVTYLYNKDILFKKIPLSVVYSFMDVNTEGNAYNWAADKTFSSAKAMQAYAKPDTRQPMGEVASDKKKLIAENISMVVGEITSHPQIQYILLFPPYSMLWWDSGYMNGISEEYFYMLEELLPALLRCDNATIYYFQDEQDIVCNLDYYMDMLHYSPQINQYMLDCVIAGENIVTDDNVNDVLKSMRTTYEYIIHEGIYQYYEK